MIVAGIGSRKTPEDILRRMRAIGLLVVRSGHTLRSGNAGGADSHFQIGGNAVDPEKVEVYLPRPGFNRKGPGFHRGNQVFVTPGHNTEAGRGIWAEAQQYHPAPDRLGAFGRRAMMRNVQIMRGEKLDQLVDVVVCWTKEGKGGGGTGQGIRIARAYDIPVIDMGIRDDKVWKEQLLEHLPIFD